MSKHQRKIDKILDTLAQGTDSVRKNPTEANYKRWEEELNKAGQDNNSWGWVIGIGIILLFICSYLGISKVQANNVQATAVAKANTQEAIKAATVQARRTATAIASTQEAIKAATVQSRRTAMAEVGETATAEASLVKVVNELVLPVEIYIDNVFQGSIKAESKKSFYLDHNHVRLDWEVIKTTTAEGSPIGDNMGGVWTDLNGGSTIYIDNDLSETTYFYPIIDNRTSQECEISINDGYIDETRPGAIVPANSDNVGLGYYRFYKNSNVTLYCEDYTYWWGLHPENGGTELLPPDKDGVVYLTMRDD